MRTRLMALTLGLLVATSPFLLAHHSFSAEYDSNKPVKVTGVVTKVEWTESAHLVLRGREGRAGQGHELGILRLALPACSSAAASAATR